MPKLFSIIVFLFLESNIFSQKVTGTITTGDGSPLSSATISVKYTGTTTLTDGGGSFTINSNKNDLWVQVLEQSGIPGKINISQDTYELVKGKFTCIHRGKVEAKNKGEIDMYFVE
jgi:hypothetical protein